MSDILLAKVGNDVFGSSSSSTPDPGVVSYDNFDRANTWVGVSNGIMSIHETNFPLSISLNTIGILVSYRASTQTNAAVQLTWQFALMSTNTIATITVYQTKNAAITLNTTLAGPSVTSRVWLTQTYSNTVGTGSWVIANWFSSAVTGASFSIWANNNLPAVGNGAPIQISASRTATSSALPVAVNTNDFSSVGSGPTKQVYIIMSS